MFRRLAFASLFVFVSGALRVLAQDAPPVAEDAPPAEYTMLIEEGLAESSMQHWLEARAIFRRAHALYPNARTLRAIGMTSFELRDYPEAYRMLRAALEATRRPLTEAQRVEVQALLDRTASLVGRYSIDGFPLDAVVRVDGVEIAVDSTREIVLPTGDHRVEVRAGDARSAGTWTVQGGEVQPLPVVAAAEETPAIDVGRVSVDELVAIDTPPSRRRRVVGRSLTAGGGVLAAMSGVFLGIGARDLRRVDDAEAGTSWSSVADAYDRGPTFTRAGVAMLAVAAPAIAIGLPIATRHHVRNERVVASVRGTVPTIEVVW